jgi:D-alanyl-D-alanine carboxypeptidase (penicillin-binding protein 5/6)
VIGGRTRTKNLHFAAKPTRRRWLRWLAALVVLVVLLVVAVVVKALVASAPALSLQRVMPARVTIPGSAPKPAWPATGEAAVEVEGLASLGSSGPRTPVPIASLAKVMTAYVVLTDHPLASGQTGFAVTITSADVRDYQQREAFSESVVPVAAGESIDELQLLEGLLVASGNNFAVLLADHDAASEPAFVAKMQSTAQQLGMSRTTYTDPSGLQASTMSTASDQLVLAAKAMADPVFAQIVAMTSANLPVAGTLPNFNKAVGSGGYVGVKTGSDSSAGGCLMFANRQSVGGRGFTILGVVVGQDQGAQSTAALLAAALKASDALVHSVAAGVAETTVVPAGTVVAVVTNPQGRRVSVRTTAPLTEMGFRGTAVPLSVSLNPVGTSLTSGQEVAVVTIAGASTPARAEAAMPPVSFGWRLRHDY